jgi:DNA-binding MarR family transcriptional regulator
LTLAAFLPFRLSVLANTVSRRLAANYERAFGITVWQWRVMAVLGETPGLAATAVAERTAMDKVAVSRAVAGLAKRGLLVRAAAKRDARRAHLRLTPAGALIYRQIAPMALAFEREMEAAFSPGERARFNAALERLAQTLSPDRPLW